MADADQPNTPPLHYAVLVPDPQTSQFSWRVIHANGDLAAARAKAEEWAATNSGHQAVVVQYVDHVQIVPQTKWARP
jgi:hypothetical protein